MTHQSTQPEDISCITSNMTIAYYYNLSVADLLSECHLVLEPVRQGWAINLPRGLHGKTGTVVDGFL